jgi:hypothetical protein
MWLMLSFGGNGGALATAKLCRDGVLELTYNFSFSRSVHISHDTKGSSTSTASPPTKPPSSRSSARSIVTSATFRLCRAFFLTTRLP